MPPASRPLLAAAAIRQRRPKVAQALSQSIGFPTTPGAYDTTYNSYGASADAFVAKLDPTGSVLAFSTYLGGDAASDFASSLVVEPGGAVQVIGPTSSSDFPVTPGAVDPTYNGSQEVWLARLSAAGDALLFSTYLGGSSPDVPGGLLLEPGGGTTLAGWTFSSDFPTTAGAYDTSLGGFQDAFLARVSAAGDAILGCTLLGGSTGAERGYGLAWDLAGNPTVAGQTHSTDFPVTAGSFQQFFQGLFTDAFVAKLSPSLDALLFSSFLGGGGIGFAGETAWGLAFDPAGSAIAVGSTNSLLFPTTPGAFDTTLEGPGTFRDAFVTKFTPAGDALLYSTYLGGPNLDEALAVAVDATGAAVVGGSTSSSNFPTTPGVLDSSLGSTYDGFLSKVSPNGDYLYYSTFLGGVGNDRPRAVSVDPRGFALVGGSTSSPDFPVSSGALDTSYNGGGLDGDGFVAVLDMLPTGASAYGASTPGCAGPLAIGVNGMPQVGNLGFALTCSHGPQNALGLLGFSAAALPSPLSLLGVSVWIDASPSALLAVLPAASNGIGTALFLAPIPPIPSLAGLSAHAQFLWADPCGPAGFSASNALAISIQP